MKKIVLLGLTAILVAVAVFTGSANASVNDFVITNFQADYYLDKDSAGRSTLKTVETITAEFPSYDQNHGIERAIPTRYDGHTVHLDLKSVTDEKGSGLEYSTYNQNDNLVVRVGNADTYVHGSVTYVLTYKQSDVTRYFNDTGLDEFYWDTNGTQWSQSFDNVTARLHLGKNIVSRLSGIQSCYFGVSGSSSKCQINKSGDLISAQVPKLGPSENMTLVIGFKPQTFEPYVMTLGDFIEQYKDFICIFVAVVLLGVILTLRVTQGKNAPGRGTIVAEYLPPKGVDVALSSVIFKATTTWASAMYVDLAVRHKLKILEVNPDDSKKSTYAMELITTDGLSDSEKSVTEALFGSGASAGARYELNKNKTDNKLARALTKIYSAVTKNAKSDGYYRDVKKLKATMSIFVVVLFLITFVNPFIGITGGVLALFVVGTTNPLSDKGRELLDYLKGLERYIKVAEEDRIKVLQSPQGADKTPVNVSDSVNLVHLYERVLPYAVLFKQEGEWVKILGKYYEQTDSSPDWYYGSTAFNAVYFSSAMSSFSTTASSNSYASSSSSSSGGGFSGGGGGGGGGGGW